MKRLALLLPVLALALPVCMAAPTGAQTTESLIASIESAVQKNKVKISTINDFTTDKVEIELVLPRGIYAEDVIQQLYAYTDCEVSISSNIIGAFRSFLCRT